MKPMLACTAEPEHIKPGYLVSAKCDGIRAVNVIGQLLTRSLKPVPNRHLQSLFAGHALHGLDGELIVGDPTAADVYRTTTSAVMRRDGEPEAVLYLFDDFTDHRMPFTERFERVQSRALELAKRGLPVVALPQIEITARNPLEAVEAAILAEGYEGVIARHPAGTYKFGRSTLRESWLLKLKRFADGEAVILRAVEQMHNANEATTNELGRTKRSSEQAGLVPAGTLGALEVRDLVSGVAFSIGSGFDAATRRLLWAERETLAGRLVAYKCFPIGAYDKPRFPTFKGLRDPADMAA